MEYAFSSYLTYSTLHYDGVDSRRELDRLLQRTTKAIVPEKSICDCTLVGFLFLGSQNPAVSSL